MTLTRAVLVGGVTALAAGGVGRAATAPVLLALTGVALALDALDGWVARRTGTVSALGGRFDMEVDAFLILVLSILVARWAGAWVLLIGAARYLFVLAGWLRPWMRRTLPARPWRKVVAATQGIVLAATVVPRGPRWVLVLALTVAWGMLAESFGRDVWWLWVRREPLADPGLEAVPASMAPNDASQRRRTMLADAAGGPFTPGPAGVPWPFSGRWAVRSPGSPSWRRTTSAR